MWIVFSVLWIAGVVAMTWRSFPPDDWVPVGALDSNAKYRPSECAGKSADECYEKLKRPGTEFDPDAFIASRNPPPPGFVVDKLRDKERRTALEFASLFALAPPILLLAFGSAFGWAFKGFHP